MLSPVYARTFYKRYTRPSSNRKKSQVKGGMDWDKFVLFIGESIAKLITFHYQIYKLIVEIETIMEKYCLPTPTPSLVSSSSESSASEELPAKRQKFGKESKEESTSGSTSSSEKSLLFKDDAMIKTLQKLKCQYDESPLEEEIDNDAKAEIVSVLRSFFDNPKPSTEERRQLLNAIVDAFPEVENKLKECIL